MKFLLLLLIIGSWSVAHAEVKTPELKTQPTEVAPGGSTASEAEKESSDYEVDYEEEPADESSVEEAPPVEEAPAKPNSSKTKGEKLSKDTTSQGSRASNRIQPLMKSESKSVYKKNGKHLDVDPD